MRLVFMGTPDIARHALAELLRAGHEVAAVYTRADKPVGRKQVLTAPPVKGLALENDIPVCQPRTLRDPAEVERLAAFEPELVVVVAYGLMLPPAVLAVPKHGCINLHVSLLPKYRGAAPIQWAVINGDAETGVSIMQLDEGMDTGPVLAEACIAIEPNATAGKVFEEATVLGGRLLAGTVDAIAAGKAQAVPQVGEATLAPRLDKAMAQMDFAMPARQLHNLARGCNPWPLAWFQTKGKRIKVLGTAVSPMGGELAVVGKAPGEVLALKPLTIACGQGALELLEVLPEGSRAMTGSEWAAGQRFGVGHVVVGLACGGA